MSLRIFPQSIGAWVRLSFSVALLAVVGHRFHADAVIGSWFYAKEEGDLLFQSLPHGELVDAIEGSRIHRGRTAESSFSAVAAGLSSRHSVKSGRRR